VNAKTRQNEMKVGALLLAALVVFAYLSVQIGAFQGFGETIPVYVTFNNASGLVVDSGVKVAGVDVGTVESLSVDFDVAVAVLQIKKEAGLRTDVRAQVRSRSLLGEKYVALTPRSKDAPLLAEGDRIESTDSVEIDDLVSALGPLLSEVNPQDVASLVGSLSRISANLGGESKTLLEKTQLLLDQLNVAAEIAPDLKAEIPPLLKDLRKTVRTTRETVEAAETTVQEARAVLAQFKDGTKGVPGVVDDLQAAIDSIEPGLDDLNRAMEQSDSAAKNLDAILANWKGFDRDDLRRLLREEGVLVRLKEPKKKKSTP
jgi:phospholipid/cholesterol/gamma-HCH transport system substrate-binding protein